MAAERIDRFGVAAINSFASGIETCFVRVPAVWRYNVSPVGSIGVRIREARVRGERRTARATNATGPRGGIFDPRGAQHQVTRGPAVTTDGDQLCARAAARDGIASGAPVRDVNGSQQHDLAGVQGQRHAARAVKPTNVANLSPALPGRLRASTVRPVFYEQDTARSKVESRSGKRNLRDARRVASTLSQRQPELPPHRHGPAQNDEFRVAAVG
jgi:hypothetical protein